MENKNILETCAVCSVKCNKFCSGCKKVYYCSQAHQKSDRKTHKKDCYPAQLLIDPEHGRHFVATKNLQPGDLIFKDLALISGPSGAELIVHKICLGCLHVVKGSYTCSKCKWPVCNVNCEKLPEHADFECQLFANAKVSPEVIQKPVEYDLIKYLRTLLLRDRFPKKWEQIQSMASHKDARAANERAVIESIASFEFIHHVCQQSQFDFDTVNHVIGVWGVNSFGANPPSGPEPTTRLASFLFPKTSLASHSCIANTRGILRESLTNHSSPGFATGMELFASLPIRAGDRILITYADVCEGTLERRRVLLDNYFFSCSCPRCQDPTEFGSFFSALICQSCMTGIVLPKDSLDPTPAAIWQCRWCLNSISYEAVSQKLSSVKEKLSQAILIKCEKETLEGVQKLEVLLEEFQGKIFHRNHWLMIDIEHRLMQHLVTKITRSPKLIPRLEEICLHCLEVANLIQPGHNSYRAKILFCLTQAKLEALVTGANHGAAFLPQKTIEEIYHYALEAQTILKLEPEGSDESKICTMLNKNLKQLEKMKYLIMGQQSYK